MPQHETAAMEGGAEFPATRWTLIHYSRENLDAQRAALDELLGAYWKPLYFYLRRKGLNVEDAKDAVQGLFVHLLERDFLERLDSKRGRFRGFLRTAADHYLSNQREAGKALKRGGGVKTVALDFDVAERCIAAAPQQADAAFDREWALEVMERATVRLKSEFDGGTRSGPFDVFALHFRGENPPAYEVSARQSGMSIPQFKSFLHRTRERFRELVRDEVSDTVLDARDADNEIADLLQALRT